MTVPRFVRLLPLPEDGPGCRIRLERRVDDSGPSMWLSEETVHPEHLDNPDANHVDESEVIFLTPRIVRWLHQMTGDLLVEIERDEPEPDEVVGLPEPDDGSGEAAVPPEPDERATQPIRRIDDDSTARMRMPRGGKR